MPGRDLEFRINPIRNVNVHGRWVEKCSLFYDKQRANVLV